MREQARTTLVRWAVADEAHRDAHLLTKRERARLAGIRHKQRAAEFVTGHGLARRVVADLLGLAAEDVCLHQVCPGCGGPHGPVTTDLPAWVSISHSHGVVTVAASPTGSVAVDVERVRTAPLAASARRLAFHPDEVGAMVASGASGREPSALASTTAWVRKELWIKRGLAPAGDLADWTTVADDGEPLVPLGSALATRSLLAAGAEHVVGVLHPASDQLLVEPSGVAHAVA